MLPASVLPITETGRVYHLNLKPSELSDTIITVGSPSRVGMVSRHFDNVEHKIQHREFVTHTGLYKGVRLSVLSTGIGSSNIDIVINEVDALKNVDFETREIKENKTEATFIRFGTTGALHDDVSIGMIIISEYAIGLDGLLNYYRRQHTPDEQVLLAYFNQQVGEIPIPVYAASADKKLCAHFSCLGVRGITVTAPGFFGPQDRVIRLPITVPSLSMKLMNMRCLDLPVLNFEMESAPLLGLGRLAGHRCASLSVVIAERQKQSFASAPEELLATKIEEFLIELHALLTSNG